MITAFVHIRCEKDSIDEVAQRLAALDGISEVYSVTGEFDIIAIVRVAAFELVASIIAGGIAKREHVLDTRTSVAFRAFSQFDLEAMFSLGAD